MEWYSHFVKLSCIMNKKFTHFNQDGEAHMVSIKDKEDTNRIAIASGSITMSVETI